MMQGLDCRDGDLAGRMCTLAFENGLVIERSGSDGRVVKFLSPLTITDDELAEGLRILKASAARAFAESVFGRPGHRREAVGAAQ
jgi:diaminobutyrate-2-oxoglutarate transaminase